MLPFPFLGLTQGSNQGLLIGGKFTTVWATREVPHKRKQQSKKRAEAEGIAWRGLCNLSAITHGYFEGPNGRKRKTFKNRNPCETRSCGHWCAGVDSQQALTTALSPPMATHTVFFLGCYSPVCGSAQVLSAPGNGQAFSGLCRPLIVSTKSSEHLWNPTSAIPSWLVLRQPCLPHLWIPRIYPRVQNTGSAKHIPISEFRRKKKI